MNKYYVSYASFAGFYILLFFHDILLSFPFTSYFHSHADNGVILVIETVLLFTVKIYFFYGFYFIFFY